MNRFAVWLGRAVLVFATVVLLFGVALAGLGVSVCGWPYRKIAGPTRRRAQLQAAIAFATTAAQLAAVLRRQPSRVDGRHASDLERRDRPPADASNRSA